MPLGDSITYGEHSSTGNGYRQALLSLLLNTTATSPPNPMFSNITYVGSQVSGDMSQSSNEGWPGYTVAQIAQKASTALPLYAPNLILLMAGTNDIVLNDSLCTAPDRLSALIGTCLTLSTNAVVVVAQLTPFADAERQAATVAYNAGVTDVVRSWIGKGAKVVGVDMQGIGGVEVGDLSDGEHPNDVGYAKMAGVWYGGVVQAVEAGWIREPVQVGSGSQVSAVAEATSTMAVGGARLNEGARVEWYSYGYGSVVVIGVMMLWSAYLLSSAS